MTPAAFFSDYVESVRPEWTAAGHLDVSRYLMLFDRATDAFRDHLGLGRDYAEANARGLVVAEAHLTYAQEVREGDVVRIRTRVLGIAPNRLHLFHEMRREAEMAVVATAELMLIHVDRVTGRSAAFAADVLNQLQAVTLRHGREPLPAQAGRSISRNRHR
jgi:acyl-CoA thioester hydrolase